MMSCVDEAIRHLHKAAGDVRALQRHLTRAMHAIRRIGIAKRTDGYVITDARRSLDEFRATGDWTCLTDAAFILSGVLGRGGGL